MRTILKNKNITNSLWNISDTFIYPIVFFCSAPFFINRLGTTQFGIWMLITTIVVTMQLFNFGIGSSVFKSVALYTGNKNESAKLKLVNNALSIAVLFCLLSILIAAILSWLVYAHNLLHLEESAKAISAQCILLAGLIVGLKFCEQIFTNYFKALEQFHLAALLSSGNRLAAILVNIILIIQFKFGVQVILVINIAVGSLFFFIGMALLTSSFEHYTYKFNAQLPKLEARFALFTWFQSIAIILTFQSDRYLVVNYFGFAVLGYYALTATMFNHLHMGFSALIPWLSPKLTKRYAQQLDGRDLYFSARNLIVALAIPLLLVFYLIYPFLFQRILGHQTTVQIIMYTKYFLVFESFFVLSIIPTYYFNAVGHEKKYLFFALFFALSAIVSMCICLHIFNKPLAIVYGLIIASAASAFLLHIMISKILYGVLRILPALALMTPSFFLSTYILTTTPVIKLISALLIFLSLYLVYIKGNNRKFQLLVTS